MRSGTIVIGKWLTLQLGNVTRLEGCIAAGKAYFDVHFECYTHYWNALVRCLKKKWWSHSLLKLYILFLSQLHREFSWESASERILKIWVWPELTDCCVETNTAICTSLKFYFYFQFAVLLTTVCKVNVATVFTLYRIFCWYVGKSGYQQKQTTHL